MRKEDEGEMKKKYAWSRSKTDDIWLGGICDSVKECVEEAKAILSLYHYKSCADVKNKDYESIMQNLKDSFKPLNEDVIDVEPVEVVEPEMEYEPEEILFDDEGLPEIIEG